MSIPPGYESNTITITVGDDFGVRRSMNDIPVGQAVAEAVWTVKAVTDLATPGDATALWQKLINTVDNTDVGQIEDTGGVSRTAQLRWDGTYLESLTGVPGKEYVYDMQVSSTAGKTFTMERGTVVFYAQVTTI